MGLCICVSVRHRFQSSLGCRKNVILHKLIFWSKNEFELELPTSKSKITFKLLTGRDENLIDSELKSLTKLGTGITREITTRLKHIIISVDCNTTRKEINNFVDNMLSKDSLYLIFFH